MTGDRDGEREDPAGRSSRVLAATDVVVSVLVALSVSAAIGVGWSYLRTGAVLGPFVREAQFVVALVGFASWTLRNRSGGQIDEVESQRSLLVLPRSARSRLNPVTRDDPSDEAPLNDDAHLFASACAVGVASIGVEFLRLAVLT
jgi:hypothetical protein